MHRYKAHFYKNYQKTYNEATTPQYKVCIARCFRQLHREQSRDYAYRGSKHCSPSLHTCIQLTRLLQYIRVFHKIHLNRTPNVLKAISFDSKESLWSLNEPQLSKLMPRYVYELSRSTLLEFKNQTPFLRGLCGPTVITFVLSRLISRSLAVQ